MARYPLFSGASNTSRSVNVDAQETINYYPENQADGAKVKLPSYPTPALYPFIATGTGPIRCIFAQDGRAFAISGSSFFEFFASQTGTFYGLVVSDDNPATISSNGTAGNQLLIISGGLGYVFDLGTNTLTAINTGTQTGFPTPYASMGAFSDGYGFALKGQSRSFSYSALEDMSVWSGLSVNEVSQGSDNLQALSVNHREIWLWGTKTTEVWIDQGDVNTPFAPLPGTFIEHGLWAPFSVATLDNTQFFLGGDTRGQGVVWKMNGYTPQRISTFAIETYINRLDRSDNAIGIAYEESGHLYYVLQLPNADTTPVYDVATGLWHKRAMWNPTSMQFEPWRVRCHAFAFGKHLVGDTQSGTIYSLENDIYQDYVVLP